MNRKILKPIRSLTPGDLIFVSWFDTSIGKSLSEGLTGIDVPVSSWGIFIGLLGQKNKHLILAQNNFRYADGLYDIDYTAIPLSWTASVSVIEKRHIRREEAQGLVSSFLMGGRRRRVPKRKRQQKVVNHRGLIKKASKRKVARKGPQGKSQIIVIPPSERLVVGVKFAMGMIGCLSAIEITHMAFLGSWSSEVFRMYFGFDRHCVRIVDRTTGLELVEKIFPERG